MKKKIAIILIVLMLVCGSNIWAIESNMALGSTMAATGIAIGVCSFVLMEEPEWARWGLVGLGGLLLIGGVWLAVSPDSKTAGVINNNKVLQHVVFDVTPDKVILGARLKR